MKLSKRSQYALRALVNLGIAQILGQPLVRIGDLAEKENLPLKFLEQIFLQLKQAGYIESKRGKQGGYLLAKPAAEIHFSEVILLLDGPLTPGEYAEPSDPYPCPDDAYCGVHALMAQVNRAIAGVLDRLTLADTIKTTLRKIRRNKATVPFVKMLMRRSGRRAAKKTVIRPNRRKKRVKPRGKRTSVSTRRQTR